MIIGIGDEPLTEIALRGDLTMSYILIKVELPGVTTEFSERFNEFKELSNELAWNLKGYGRAYRPVYALDPTRQDMGGAELNELVLAFVTGGVSQLSLTPLHKPYRPADGVAQLVTDTIYRSRRRNAASTMRCLFGKTKDSSSRE